MAGRGEMMDYALVMDSLLSPLNHFSFSKKFSLLLLVAALCGGGWLCLSTGWQSDVGRAMGPKGKGQQKKGKGEEGTNGRGSGEEEGLGLEGRD